jgi:hypothetical protein
MDNKAAAFFVSEDEYPKLQAACPGDFPFTYAEFAGRVDEGIQNAPGLAVIKVYVEVNEFLAWCAENKLAPVNTSRGLYAAMLLNRRGLN